MAKKQCGECKQEINDLEPICCGFCEASFHINQQCCGFNSRSIKEAFASGKAMFICPPCRTELNGRSIRAYLADNPRSQPDEMPQLAEIPKQVQELFTVVEKLSQKIDNFAGQSIKPFKSIPVSSPSAWPRLGIKRRRDDRRLDECTAAVSGTKSIDLSEFQLPVPSIMQAAKPDKFWLYMTGLNPLINDSDVQKIVSRCLNISDAAEVIRLVPRGKDVTTLTFVSYKIGLDPDLKELALEPSSWPTGIRLREFVDFSKN
ncbi:uncharacterized protein LOC134210889 [Armigeres subalbatus]|uniref:uncharacterized protein LOC134210889 n=1 Tax=Armigeres subalbatus TaxID=124917 RepID=UPI002ED2BAA8